MSWSAARLEQPEAGAAVSLPPKDNTGAIRRERRIAILGGVAHRVGQRPSVATGGWHLPQLSEEIENDGAAIGREVEAQLGALVHSDGDCLRRTHTRGLRRGGWNARGEQDGER